MNAAVSRPKSTRDLSPTERRFVLAMHELRFGRFEFLRIESGELVLDPWPATIRAVKFGTGEADKQTGLPDQFDLKRQVADFFEHVRSMNTGTIRCLNCAAACRSRWRSNTDGVEITLEPKGIGLVTSSLGI